MHAKSKTESKRRRSNRVHKSRPDYHRMGLSVAQEERREIDSLSGHYQQCGGGRRIVRKRLED